MDELGRSMSPQPPHKKIAQKEPFYDLCFDWRLNLVLEGGKSFKRGDKQVAGTRMYNIILYIYMEYTEHAWWIYKIITVYSCCIFLLLSPHGPQPPAIHFQVKFLDHLSSTTSKTQGLHRRSVEMSRWPGNNPALVRRLGRGAGWYRFHFFVKSLGVRRWRLAKKEAGLTWRIIPLGGILVFFNHGDRFFSPRTWGCGKWHFMALTKWGVIRSLLTSVLAWRRGCVDPNLEGKLLENAYPIFVLSERWLEKKHDKRQWNR